MLLLASTSDLLRVVTTTTASTDVHVSWCDLSGTTVTPGRTNTATIATATTTTIVAAPAPSTYRTVKTIRIRNRHASTSQDVTIIHTDGTNALELSKATLAAGEAMHYDEHAGVTVRDAQGRTKSTTTNATGAVNVVVLTADVANANGVANTIADVTGFSFPVTSGETYWFRYSIMYTSAATTTGSRWSINGPAATFLSYYSRYHLSATTETVNHGLTAYDLPAAANITSVVAGNNAEIEGILRPSASGTVIARFASEVLSSAITAKAGSILLWARTL